MKEKHTIDIISYKYVLVKTQEVNSFFGDIFIRNNFLNQKKK